MTTVGADAPHAGAVIDRLARAVGAVERRETHGSWVLLTRTRAYKVKKPVVMAFLDYGTLARRRRMCRAEVELNRRTAPGIYLGVRALDALVVSHQDSDHSGGALSLLDTVPVRTLRSSLAVVM